MRESVKNIKQTANIILMSEKIEGPLPDSPTSPVYKGHLPQRRKLNQIKLLEEFLKEICPIHMDKLLSHIEYKMGFARENARNKLMILFDVGKIDINTETKIVSVKDEKVEQSTSTE